MSRRRTRFVPKDSSRHRTWVYVGIVAFVLADILLIAFALGANRAEDAPAGASQVESPPAVVGSAEATAPKPTATPTARTDTAVLPVPSTRILTAFDDSTAWRAITGACPDTDASPELTSDAGETWRTTDATGPTEVTAVQRILVDSESVVSMIGLSQADCAPQFVKSFVSGDNYSSYPDLLADAWYVDPADRATVHSPTGTMKAPCGSVVMIAPRDSNAAAVLCADGRAATTKDAGAMWSKPVAVPGVLTLTGSANGYLAAAIRTDGCDGVRIIALTEALASTSTGCFVTPEIEPAETLAEEVALSQAGDAVWLWLGNSLAISGDQGATWQRR